MITTVDATIARRAARILLSLGAVTINTKKPYRYTSGILSPMYTDCRLFISYPKEWKKILGMYVRVIKKHIGLSKFDVLSGTATAAIPHAAALSILLDKPMVYDRSSKKEHGKGNQIEGTFKNGSRVLIVEDLISLGKSSGENIAAIRNAGGKVSTCIAITTSTSAAFEKAFEEFKVRLITLTNVLTTIDVAFAKKLINLKQKKSVEGFLQDPPSWGKKMGFE